MTGLKDEVIMNKVRDGNLAELSGLFERYYARMYNFFLTLTNDKSTSKDLVQDLFARIIKYRSSYKGNGTFKSWIYRMARNIHIDYCNQNKKTLDQLKDVKNHQETMMGSKEIYDDKDYSKLERALQQLSPEQQQIIVLSRFQGLKYEEISKIQNASVAAIKVQVHRALKQLRLIYFNLA